MGSFLAGRDHAGELDLAGLTAAEVTGFVVETCPGLRKGTAKLTVTALRSLLGWFHVADEICEQLAWAVPAVASWRLAGLPKALEPGRSQRCWPAATGTLRLAAGTSRCSL